MSSSCNNQGIRSVSVNVLTFSSSVATSVAAFVAAILRFWLRFLYPFLLTPSPGQHDWHVPPTIGRHSRSSLFLGRLIGLACRPQLQHSQLSNGDSGSGCEYAGSRRERRVHETHLDQGQCHKVCYLAVENIAVLQLMHFIGSTGLNNEQSRNPGLDVLLAQCKLFKRSLGGQAV